MPSRFLLTCGHFITAVLAFYNTPTNVAAGYPLGGSASELSLGRASLLTALAISMICFLVQFGGLFGGYTMFRNQLNLFHCVAHFFGGVLTAWYLIDAWGFLSYWCVRHSLARKCRSAQASQLPCSPAALTSRLLFPCRAIMIPFNFVPSVFEGLNILYSMRLRGGK